MFSYTKPSIGTSASAVVKDSCPAPRSVVTWSSIQGSRSSNVISVERNSHSSIRWSNMAISANLLYEQVGDCCSDGGKGLLSVAMSVQFLVQQTVIQAFVLNVIWILKQIKFYGTLTNCLILGLEHMEHRQRKWIRCVLYFMITEVRTEYALHLP